MTREELLAKAKSMQTNAGDSSREALLERAKLLERARSIQARTSEPEAPAEVETSAGDKAATLLQNFGNTSSFGYLPQLQALSEPTITKTLDFLTGNKVAESMGDYVQRRDEATRSMAAADKRNPGYALAGQALGLIPTMALPGGAALKIASTPLKALAMGGIGAAQSALVNPGDTEGEVNPLQIGERGSNAATAGLISALLPFAPAAGGKLKDKAGELAFKSLGPYAKEAKKALAKGRVGEIGRELLDKNIIRFIPTGSENMLNRISAEVKKSGKSVEEFIAGINESSKFPFGKGKIADKLKENLLVSSKAAEDIQGASQRNAALSGMIEDFQKGSTKPTSFSTKGSRNLVEVDPSTLKTKTVKEPSFKSGSSKQVSEAVNDLEWQNQLRTLKEPGKIGLEDLIPDASPEELAQAAQDPQVQKILAELNQRGFSKSSEKLATQTPEMTIDPYTMKQKLVTKPVTVSSPVRETGETVGDLVWDNQRGTLVKKADKSILDWWKTKQVADDFSGWNKDTRVTPLTSGEEYNRALAKTVGEGFDDIGGYTEVAKPYSLLKEAENISKIKEARELAKQFAAPTVIGGAGGLAMGGADGNFEDKAMNALQGAVILGGLNATRRYGTQSAAKILDTAGKGLEKSGVVANNPWLIPTLLRESSRGE